jgi:D-arabinose 1-dehydrogenase-like Zn-dependent alcohol dehydrogenase
MPKMRAVQVPRPGAPFELVERDIPDPGPRSVRIKVRSCGICHSDVLTKEGAFPGIRYPRVPGHEVAGVVDAVGSDVVGWDAGDMVGVGWHGGHCGHCKSCRRGDFVTCQIAPQVPGITYDGGYAEYMIAPAVALAAIPDEMSPVDAGPLMCAGITTFNSLRHSGARAGDLVAVLGVGGLGHLGVQFAAKMGFRTVAIARGKDKEPLSRTLGAHDYIDSEKQDPAAELLKLGGARVILATVTNGTAMSATLAGLGVNGSLIVLGAPHEPLEVPAYLLIGGRRSIAGWPSGTSIDSQDTLAFSAMAGVRPMTEEFPLERASDGYERMMSGQARFGVVFTLTVSGGLGSGGRGGLGQDGRERLDGLEGKNSFPIPPVPPLLPLLPIPPLPPVRVTTSTARPARSADRGGRGARRAVLRRFRACAPRRTWRRSDRARRAPPRRANRTPVCARRPAARPA